MHEPVCTNFDGCVESRWETSSAVIPDSVVDDDDDE